MAATIKVGNLGHGHVYLNGLSLRGGHQWWWVTLAPATYTLTSLASVAATTQDSLVPTIAFSSLASRAALGRVCSLFSPFTGPTNRCTIGGYAAASPTASLGRLIHVVCAG